MFDTMTLTKIVGGFCGALLVFLLGNWAAEAIYGGEGGHGEAEQAYVIPVEESATTVEAVEEGPSFAEVFATADVAAGEKLFRNCAACHSTEAGKTMTGPSLHGIVGRAAGSIEGFKYSGAFEGVVDVWTPENLDHFLADPRGFAAGTAMTYAGMAKVQDRANLIAYLASLGG